MTQDTSETFLFKKSKFAHFRDPSGLLDVVDLSNDSVFSEQIYTDAIPTLENLTISSAAQSVANINTLADSVSENTGTAGDSSQSFITRYQRIRLEYIADSSPVAYRPKTTSINLKNIIQNYDKFCFFVFSNNASGGYYTPLAGSPLTFTIKNGVLLCLNNTIPENALSDIQIYGSTSDTSHLYLNCYMYSGTYAAGVVSLAGTQTVAGDKTFSGTTTITTADINGGTIDGATIATSDVTVGAGKTLNVSSGTLTTSAAQNKTIMQGASSNIDIGAYDLRAATITADGLTSGRVVFAGTNGVLSNDSDLTFSGSTLTVSDIEITGSLTINDTASATTINSVNVDISDNLIIINDGLGSAANLNDSGILIERGSSGDNAFMGWDESADKFTMGTTTATGTATGNLSITTGTLVANLQGNVTGNVTGNASGTAATVTGAAQTAITSVGTLTGLTVNGTLSMSSSKIISFASTTDMKIDLGYGSAYSIGVQDYTTYFRSGADFCFFKGGTHTDTRSDPGTGGTLNMIIKEGGNVGIGTASPATKLEVSGEVKLGGGTYPSHFNHGTTNDAYIRSGESTGTVHIQDSGGGVKIGTGNKTHFNWDTNKDAYIRSGESTGKVIIQDTGGNVGIGTTDPGANLHVAYGGVGTSTLGNQTIRIGDYNFSGSASTYADNLFSIYWGLGVGMGPYSSSRSVFGSNQGLGIHMNPDEEFSVRSNSWSPLFGVLGKAVANVADSRVYVGGKLGIGTTTPKRTLDLSTTGQITFGDDVTGNNTSRPGIFWHNNNDWGIYRTSGDWDNGSTYRQLLIKWPTGIILYPSAGLYSKSHVGVVGGVAVGSNYSSENSGPTASAASWNNGMIIEGKVGIGTTDPGAKLHIKGGNLRIENTGSDSLDNKIIFEETDYNDRFFIATDLAGSGGSNQNLGFGFTTDGDSGIINDNLLVNIKGDGKVGIGTTGPIKDLDFGDVGGDIRMGGIANQDSAATNSIGHMYSNGGGLYGGIQFISNGNHDELGFVTHKSGTGSGERMRIDSLGNVGIGTTSPSYKLDLGSGSARIHNIMFEDNGNDHYSRIKMTGGNTFGYIYSAYNSALGDGIHMGYNAYKEDGNSAWIKGAANTGSSRISMGYEYIALHTSEGTAGPENNALIIKGNGKIGIGYTTPNSKLQINNHNGVSHSSYMTTANGFNSNSLLIAAPTTMNISYGVTEDLLYLHRDGKAGISYGRSICFGLRNETNNVFFDLRYKVWSNNATFYNILTVNTSNQNVGIGTSAPNYPLQVNGYSAGPGGGSRYFGPTSNNITEDSTLNDNTSIYAEYMIVSNTYIAAGSDERMKTEIEDVSDNLALEKIRNIPCRYYHYKDNLRRGTEKTIGFISQEVKQVFPQATHHITGHIPCFQIALQDYTWIERIINPDDPSNNTTVYDLSINQSLDLSSNEALDCSGVCYRFYVSNDPSGNDEIEKDIVGNSDNTFTFDTSYNNIFVWGKQIDDYLVLDKQKIYSLHHSAIQEIDRQQLADKQKIAQLETKVSTLETQLADVLSRLSALEAN